MSARWLCLALLALGVLGCPSGHVVPVGTLPVPIGTGKPTVQDPAAVTDGDVSIAYENGLRILVKRTPGAEIAAMHLYIQGGARFRTKENAGLEYLALETAVHGGTQELDKDAFSRKLTALGSELGSSTTHSYSVVGASALNETFDETFGLMVDAFLSPALPDSELAQQRERQLVGIKRRDETPDGKLGMLVIDAMYKDHPYANMADGSLESVSSFTAEQVRGHLASLRVTSRLVLVVVGDIAPEHVQDLVRGKLGKLPRGEYRSTPIAAPDFAKPKTVVVSDKLPTNYIEASFVGPGWGESDFAAGILAMRVLRHRVWEEVRTKRNLSYAPSAGFRWSSEVTRGSLYVTAVDANQTMRVMLDEVARLQSELVPEKVLAGAKGVFLTSHLMANEATGDQATWLALCDLVGGDWKLSRTLPDRIRAVTAAQVQAFAKKHIKNLQTVVLGDPEKVDRAIFESR